MKLNNIIASNRYGNTGHLVHFKWNYFICIHISNLKLLIKLWRNKELSLSKLTMAKEYLHPYISNFVFNINTDDELINHWKDYLNDVMEYRMNLNIDLVKQLKSTK